MNGYVLLLLLLLRGEVTNSPVGRAVCLHRGLEVSELKAKVSPERGAAWSWALALLEAGEEQGRVSGCRDLTWVRHGPAEARDLDQRPWACDLLASSEAPGGAASPVASASLCRALLGPHTAPRAPRTPDLGPTSPQALDWISFDLKKRNLPCTPSTLEQFQPDIQTEASRGQ